MRVVKLAILLFLLSLCHIAIAQTDTIYVDEVDTVLVEEAPLIVNRTIYHQLPAISKREQSLLVSASALWDLSHYEVCATCEENFQRLRAASSYTRSMQYGIQFNYWRTRWSVGIRTDYRASVKHIQYSNDTLAFASTLRTHYLMVGPSLGYKLLNKEGWGIALYGGVLLSFTKKQSGQTLGGDYVRQLIDLEETELIARRNLLYFLNPVLSFKVSNTILAMASLHYYFDHYSNTNRQQSYTEQRNTVGTGIGLAYLF